MKNLTTIGILAIAAILSACDKPEPANQKTSVSTSSTFELKVIDWGAQSAKVGTNPIKQPDGTMGLWIEVSGTQGLGEAQVLFSGQPAKLTTVQEKLITAAITTDQLAVAGNKEVAIKQIATGKLFPVGIFKLTVE